MPKWINFIQLNRPQPKKTNEWIVAAADGTARLGTIKWFTRWRRYAFFPDLATVFEQDCLRDIADFIEQITQEHKAQKNEVAQQNTL